MTARPDKTPTKSLRDAYKVSVLSMSISGHRAPRISPVRYLSIFDSQRGADQKEILDARLPSNEDRTFLADKLRYLLKSPRKAYRVYRTERVTSDGEIVPCFRQRKSELRKGDRITLFHLMKGLYLDELAAAGGDGTDMMRRIKRAAVRVRGSRPPNALGSRQR
jgi:hypothetical protein